MEGDTQQTSPNGASPLADFHEAVRRRAEEIYIRSGKIPGRDLENWTQAEEEVRSEAARQNRRTAVIIRVEGVQYVGEYRRESADGYVPGEFAPGTPVSVQIDGATMLVKRANGKTLQTQIVKRMG